MLYSLAKVRFVLIGLVMFTTLSSQSVAGPNVVVSITPLHSITSSIMEGMGQPQLLIQSNQSPHGFSLKPSQRLALQRAELVIWVGEGLESSIAKAVSLHSEKVFGLDQYEDHLTMLMVRDLDGDDDDHASENHDVNGHDDDKHHHDHSGEDPHFWLNPLNAAGFAEALAERLSQLDSDNTAQYQQNLERFIQQITELDEELANALKPVKQSPFLVMHDGYQYLDTHYQLNFAGALTLNPEIMPGVRRISDLSHRIEELGVVCIFAEPQISQGVIRQIAAREGIAVGVLDPLGVELKPGSALYTQMMRNNATEIVTCLGR